jgi:hypothetical protein
MNALLTPQTPLYNRTKTTSLRRSFAQMIFKPKVAEIT